MYSAITKVQPYADFSLTVTFEDGVVGRLDMQPYLNFGVFKKLHDFNVFKQVRISFDTVAWDCGVDLDPEFINRACRQKG